MTKKDDETKSEYSSPNAILALCISVVKSCSAFISKGFSDSRNMTNFMAPKSSAFHKTIVSGDFWTINDDTLLRQIHEEFADELERLKRAYSIRDTDVALPKTRSPSQILYGTDFDEVNRTLVGVYALRWIRSGNYEAFVGSQPGPIKLKCESFEWMQKIFRQGIKTPTDLYSLVLSIVINDLGKDPKLAEEYYDMTGEDISGMNHDMILLKAVKIGMVHCLYRLNRSDKADIVQGMQLGSEFNFGQLAQAENTPACVSGLLEMRGHARSFEVRFLEQLLDVAGAAGHMDWTCAKKFIEPIYQAYHNVYDVATGIISGHLHLRDGYDIILIRRGELLEKTGFRALSVHKPKERALMRLLCMGGAADLETAQLYDNALSNLEETTKKTLVEKLNIDGTVAEPAVQPTYVPAMLVRGINNTPSGSVEEKTRALQSLLRYLAKVLTVTEKPKEPISVIERSVRGALKDVLDGAEFKANPDVLESVAVPKDEVAQMGVIEE